MRNRALWLEMQLGLADLYRAVGREDEALAIEKEVRRYSAFADPDFPIVRMLASR